MDNRKEHYSKKGLYNGYNKNHKEREALDYYSTPIEEVENILNYISLDLDNSVILEPCCGGGHMVQGITNYCYNHYKSWSLIATDVQMRESILKSEEFKAGLEYDFLADNYPYTENIDYVIINPPFSTIEAFVMKALSIANKGILMLGRLQFLEGEKRYEKILKECPPSDVYVYVDRITCYKNGNDKEKMASAQAYAWFYWDFTKDIIDTKVHWIRRVDKK